MIGDKLLEGTGAGTVAAFLVIIHFAEGLVGTIGLKDRVEAETIGATGQFGNRAGYLAAHHTDIAIRPCERQHRDHGRFALGRIGSALFLERIEDFGIAESLIATALAVIGPVGHVDAGLVVEGSYFQTTIIGQCRTTGCLGRRQCLDRGILLEGGAGLVSLGQAQFAQAQNLVDNTGGQA